MDPITTQIGLFASACCAHPVHSPDDVHDARDCNRPLKLCFDGCGVTNGQFWGVLFAAGLDKQVDTAVKVVQKMLYQQERQNQEVNGVHVVAVGLSRGGMACMKFARKLAQTFPKQQQDQASSPLVTASALLFDPVPGNAVSTGFPWTACWAHDLSQCHNLERVLALYPYEALPDVAMHAPTLCRYNSTTTLVQEDVTLGCHQGALFLPTPTPRNHYEVASYLSIRRILDYLEYEGVECRIPASVFVPSPEDCIEVMDVVLKASRRDQEVLRRKTHDHTGQHRAILRYNNNGQKQQQWLNKHHEQLVQAREKAQSTATLTAVFGEEPNNESQSSSQTTTPYQLDFDDGYVTCPVPFTSVTST